jgi:hypothetical protein
MLPPQRMLPLGRLTYRRTDRLATWDRKAPRQIGERPQAMDARATSHFAGDGTPALAVRLPRVPLYFFDTRDNDHFIEDDEGLEFPDLEAVKIEAARALADIARDVLPGSLKRELAVEVRDELGPVLRALLTFEAVILRPS